MTKPSEAAKIIDRCGDCMMLQFNSPFLVEACASVGIEHGKSTERMMLEYLWHYHQNDHKFDE